VTILVLAWSSLVHLHQNMAAVSAMVGIHSVDEEINAQSSITRFGTDQGAR